MSTRSLLVVACVLSAAFALAQPPNLGKPASPADVAAWDINILPDGTGLPAGSGMAADGARVYSAKCAGCHGPEGKGGAAAKLVGAEPVKNMSSEKTIAGYWPYSTTLFDYIRRAMPFQQPRSLTNEEVYALTAYILAQNKLIGASDAMNAQTLPKVKMPNRDGFIVRFPERMP
jgi:mono/diheme cytochrome c family protein